MKTANRRVLDDRPDRTVTAKESMHLGSRVETLGRSATSVARFRLTIDSAAEGVMGAAETRSVAKTALHLRNHILRKIRTFLDSRSVVRKQNPDDGTGSMASP